MGYIVFKCPRCGRYMYAPRGQKTRLCVFCGKIIRIPDDGKILPTSSAARILVARLNAGETYIELPGVDRIKTKIPTKKPGKLPQSKLKLLLTLIRRGRQSLTVLLRDAIGEGLNEEWVNSTLEHLSRQGEIYYPRPWEISPVSYNGKSTEDKIIRFLSNSPHNTDEIVNLLKIPKEKVIAILESMEKRGIIIREGETWRR